MDKIQLCNKVYKKNYKFQSEEKNVYYLKFLNNNSFGEIIDNKPHGRWWFFTNDFKFEVICHYKNGLLHGDYFYFCEKNQCIYCHIVFENGKKIKIYDYNLCKFPGLKGCKVTKNNFWSMDCFDKKFKKFYPIPDEIHHLLPKIVLDEKTN